MRGSLGGVSGRKRTNEEMEIDLTLTMELYLKGVGYKKIAEAVNEGKPYQVSHVTIFKDVVKGLKQWHEQRLQLIDRHVTIELAKIDRLEVVYMDAWERSRQAVKKEITKQSGPTAAPNWVSMTTEKREVVGDPRWLEGLQWCINKRCELLGLNKVAGTGSQSDLQGTKPTVSEIVFTTKKYKALDANISEAIVISETHGNNLRP